MGEVDDDGLDDQTAARVAELAARGQRLTATEKLALVLSRRGQGQFRQDLVALWGRCAITGCHDARLLRASHLKPWKDSTNMERLDPYNGLLLAPHLDHLLDRGFITFANDGILQRSSHLRTADFTCLGIHRAMKLGYVDKRHQVYLNYHRKNVFRQ